MARGPLILRDEHGNEREVEVKPDGSVSIDDQVITVRQAHPGEMRAGDRTVWAAGDGDRRWIFLDGEIYILDVRRPGDRVRRSAGPGANLAAPMPATVIKILTSPGDLVRPGDILIILEAMKMELPVRAAVDGVVASVRCREGELVHPGQDLIEIAAAPSAQLPAPKEDAADR